MAVVSAKEVWEGRDGGYTAGLSRDYTRTFWLLGDSLGDDNLVAEFAADPVALVAVPLAGSTYANAAGTRFDPLAYLDSVHAGRHPPNPLLWVVTCEYRTPNLAAGGGSIADLRTPARATCRGRTRAGRPASGSRPSRPPGSGRTSRSTCRPG